MTQPALSKHELGLITSVFRKHPQVEAAKVFGSRAKGNSTASSDVDLALWGDVDALRAERIAAELDELPLAYRFDVKSFTLIKLQTLQEHIERVGIVIYKKEKTTSSN